VRVHELAARLGRPSRVVMPILRSRGHILKSVASVIPSADLPGIWASLAGTDAPEWATVQADYESEQHYRHQREWAESRTLLTCTEAAQKCGVTPSAVRQWVRRGKLTPAAHDGKGQLFDLLDVTEVEHATRTAARRAPKAAGSNILPPDEIDSLITATEAAALCGVTAAAVRQWAARGRLTARSTDERGRKLYRLLDVAKVEHATRTAARR